MSTRDYSAAAKRFQALLQRVAPAEAEQVERHEKMLRPFDKSHADELAAYYEALTNTLQAHRDRLRADFQGRPDLVDLAIQEARSRVRLVRQLELGPGKGPAVRDAAMADNLDFLLDRLYPGHKLIVWAHNAHVAYQGPSEGKFMGHWVAERRRKEVYTVGLYMGRGAAAMNNREVYAIEAPAPDTMEALMSQAGRKFSFVDLSRVPSDAAGAGWMQQRLPAREWGTQRFFLAPALAYDGLIYIDTVTPPAYR